MPYKLGYDEFTNRLEPIARSVESRGEWPRPFNPEFFFPHWQALIKLGIAEVWEAPGAILGAVFTTVSFTGTPVGVVSFWWSLPDAKVSDRMSLLEQFESECRARGCEFAYTSAYGTQRHAATERLYRRRGYSMIETNFRKELKYG